ncbi:MAG: HNH endonuclease [Prolixibacteraceae bacterium]|nr:HNH endonuclease [Prolixibacteraceae bacterium]
MVNKDDHERNPEKFTFKPKFRHKEHIIQNALGGRLKTDGILCESCGSKLNDEIDTEFISLFKLFTEKMKSKLAKERNRNISNEVKGRHMVSGKEIVYKDGRITAKKPHFEIDEVKKRVCIYANQFIMVQYKEHVRRTLLAQELPLEHYSIEEITEFADDENIGLYFSEGVNEFNAKWLMGYIKIATEFAIYCGINRTQLLRTLDTKAKKLINTDCILPFFPIGVFDMMIEQNRIFLERYYPSHTLILFTEQNRPDKKVLFCYIDLFSTFQFYVVLNDNYSGDDVFKTYCQKLEKEIKPEVDFRKLRLKHIRPVSESVGISFDKYEGKTIEELYQYVEAEYAKLTTIYELDLSEELYQIILNMVSAIAVATSNGTVSNPRLSIPVESFTYISDEWRGTVLRELKLHLNPDDTINPKYFRQQFLEPKGEDGYEILSTPSEIIHEMKRNETPMVVYGHMKFSHLSYYASKSTKPNFIKDGTNH